MVVVMDSRKPDIIEDYGMYFAKELDNAMVSLLGVGYQTRSSNSYYWDNRNRFDCYLFQYTLSGTGIVEIGEKKYKVHAGEAFYLQLPSDSKYYYDETESTEPWEFIYLLYRGDAMHPYYHYVEKAFGNILKLSPKSPLIKSLFQMYTDVKNEVIRDPFLINSQVFHFVSQLCSLGYETHRKLSPKMERAKLLMEQHFANAININAIAEHLSVSPEYLSRQFLKETGMKPVEYLNQVKISHAARMLTDTNLTLEAIAQKCGFSNGNYLQKVFKKQMNMTPGQFRDHFKKEGISNL